MRILGARILVDFRELARVQARAVRIPRVRALVEVVDASETEADGRQVALEVGRSLRRHRNCREEAMSVVREPVRVVLHLLQARAARQCGAVLALAQRARARIQRYREVDVLGTIDFDHTIIRRFGQVIIVRRNRPFVAVVPGRRHAIADDVLCRASPVRISGRALLADFLLLVGLADVREYVLLLGLLALLRCACLLLFCLAALFFPDILLLVLLADVLVDGNLVILGADVLLASLDQLALVDLAVTGLRRRVDDVDELALVLHDVLLLPVRAGAVDVLVNDLVPVFALCEIVDLTFVDVLPFDADIAKDVHRLVLGTDIDGAGLLLFPLDALVAHDGLPGDAGRLCVAGQRSDW